MFLTLFKAVTFRLKKRRPYKLKFTLVKRQNNTLSNVLQRMLLRAFYREFENHNGVKRFKM